MKSVWVEYTQKNFYFMEIRMDATIELIEIELFLITKYFPPFIVGLKISQNPVWTYIAFFRPIGQ